MATPGSLSPFQFRHRRRKELGHLASQDTSRRTDFLGSQDAGSPVIRSSRLVDRVIARTKILLTEYF